MSYKIELHCHSFPVSGCSNLQGETLVRLYAQAGYSAITVTDHFTPDFFRYHTISDYFYGYHAALAEGERIGIKVYLGAEFRFSGSSNDYLLFGVNEEFLRGATDYFGSTNAEFYAYCKKNGVLIYQAHPFRDNMQRAPLGTLDGIEIYNMHPNHRARNGEAKAYAEANGLHGLSGSDAHEIQMVGRGGIISETLPEDGIGLRDLILSRNYELYHEGVCKE